VTDSVWTTVLKRAEELLELVSTNVPTGEFTVPAAHAHIVGMFWRSRRLYDGVLLLLKAELPEEALFLARSLFEDSLRLRQLAADVQSRDAFILGWANRSLEEQRGLLNTGVATGQDEDISAAVSALNEQQRHLREYATRHGVTRLLNFDSIRHLAFRFGRKDDLWTYQLSHESVHGSDSFWMFARRRPAADAAAFHAKNADPIFRSSVALFAARSMRDATVAASAVFGWSMPSRVAHTVTEIEKLDPASQ
jgi:hypothetical protein